MTNGNLSVSTNLNSKAIKKKTQTTEEEQKGVIPLPYDNYVDFNVPWNVNISYSLIYTKPYFEPKITQTLNLNGSLSLTQKWMISFNSGFDLESKELTYTSLNVHRDLHCWEMSFSWVPFGYTQNYLFRINVKSSVLKDLKLDKKKSYYDY
jgi:hypothetical protein